MIVASQPRRRTFATFAGLLLLAVLTTASAVVSAQNQNLSPAEERAIADAALAASSAPTGPPATLVYANRPIVELRSPLLGRSPRNASPRRTSRSTTS